MSLPMKTQVSHRSFHINSNSNNIFSLTKLSHHQKQQQQLRAGHLAKGSSPMHPRPKVLRFSTSNSSAKNPSTTIQDNISRNSIIPDKSVGYWLLGTSVCVFGIAVLGAATRLAKSKISTSTWKGTSSMLPSNENEWKVEYEKYISQSHQGIKYMTNLAFDEFKELYTMEWVLKQSGKALGLIFVLPLIGFVGTGRIQKIPGLTVKLASVAALIGLQGYFGAQAAKENKNKGRDQSQNNETIKQNNPYRLAEHLTTTFAIHTGLLWCGLTALRPNQLISQSTSDAVKKAIKRAKHGGNGMASIVALTAFSGLFVAGNDAGRAYNDWPLYAGRIVPDDLWREKYQPAWTNFSENTALVQFNHRNLAYLVAIGTFFTWKRFRKPEIWSNLNKESQLALNLSLAAVTTQVGLGIITLMTFVPTSLGTIHQAGALTVWSVSLWFQHTLRYIK